jgi:hypothetical protein
MRRPAPLILALALGTWQPCSAAEAPTIRPLDPAAEETPAPTHSEPARKLPATVAVCHEPTAPRCWTAPRAEDCARDSGQVFRVVIGGAGGPDAVAALAQCRSAGAPAPR